MSALREREARRQSFEVQMTVVVDLQHPQPPDVLAASLEGSLGEDIRNAVRAACVQFVKDWKQPWWMRTREPSVSVTPRQDRPEPWW